MRKVNPMKELTLKILPAGYKFKGKIYGTLTERLKKVEKKKLLKATTQIIFKKTYQLRGKIEKDLHWCLRLYGTLFGQPG